MSQGRETSWRDIKYIANQISDSDLDKPVHVFNSRFDRLFAVVTVDHLDTFKTGKKNEPGSPLVMVIDNAVS